MTTALPFKFFDCDNHYYEAEDAFTRYIDPKLKKRAIQWAQLDGRQRLLVGGRVNRFIPNPTFDRWVNPVRSTSTSAAAIPRGADLNALFGELEPIRPEYRNRDARLEAMDAQGMQGCIMLPTLASGWSRRCSPDFDATIATFKAFNRWLDEDWGFAYQERIFTAPYITMCRPADAVRELEWALERDARFIVMIPGADHHRGRDATPPVIRCSTSSGSWPTIPVSRCATTPVRPTTRSSCRRGGVSRTT